MRAPRCGRPKAVEVTGASAIAVVVLLMYVRWTNFVGLPSLRGGAGPLNASTGGPCSDFTYKGNLEPMTGSWARVNRVPQVPPWMKGENGCLEESENGATISACIAKSPFLEDYGAPLYLRERLDDILENGFLEFRPSTCPLRHLGADEAVELYRHRTVVFAGDSTTKGHYQAFLNYVSGTLRGMHMKTEGTISSIPQSRVLVPFSCAPFARERVRLLWRMLLLYTPCSNPCVRCAAFAPRVYTAVVL